MTPLAATAKGMLSEDFLAPAVAATLYPDLVQRILPVANSALRPARAPRNRLERAWEKHAGSRRFAETLDGLWQKPRRPLAAGVAAERHLGRNRQTSDRQQPARAAVTRGVGETAGVRRRRGRAPLLRPARPAAERSRALERALHLCQSGGTLVKDGRIHGRAVDGGYFENSGATSVLEILKVLGQLAKPGTSWRRSSRT